jgi:molecular chaperone DnaJ
MQKNPFIVLGVDENITQTELTDAYRLLRVEYENQRFLPGEAGANACERLDEIDAAYKEALQRLQARYFVSEFSNPYKGIEDKIKAGQLEEAQNELDNILNRDAEWHFYQSMILFRKGWYVDTSTHLKLAIAADPSNQKYRDALKNFETKMDAKREERQASEGDPDAQFYTSNKTRRSYKDTNADRNTSQASNNCCNCCTSFICADCCCECMGGDLCSCC